LTVLASRCGVEPLELALALSRAVEEGPELRCIGLMGYDGHGGQRAAG
jgi:D-serine deaminase-like pyridoxal phosphate-dependent protein